MFYFISPVKMRTVAETPRFPYFTTPPLVNKSALVSLHSNLSRKDGGREEVSISYSN